MEYNRLEKIEISGINGPRLSAQVVMVFDDFNQLFKHLTEKQFDCLNPDDTVRKNALVYGKMLVSENRFVL